MLAWATMVAVTSAFEVADPFRITLFAAGAAFEGALLAPDPQPRDRVRTLGWAAVVAAKRTLGRAGSPWTGRRCACSRIFPMRFSPLVQTELERGIYYSANPARSWRSRSMRTS